ncbi:MAG: hypothetical protein MJ175_07430 [Clostridia bacterium]|nr:hypothetical protein [Clostridia bacterium]
MKRLFTLFLAMMLITSVMMMNTNATVKFEASDVTFITAYDFDDTAYGELIYEAAGDMNDVAGYFGEIGVQLFDLAPGSRSFCVKDGAYVWYDFTADVAGTYTFALDFVAVAGTDRGINVVIDPSTLEQAEQTFLLLDPCDSVDDHRYATFQLDLNAGVHQIFIAVPTGFDNSTLKSCNFFGVNIFFTAEAAPAAEETPAEETPAEDAAAEEAPVEGTPVEDVVDVPAETIVPAPEAPKTADAGIVAAAAVMAAAAAVVLSKKH